MKLPPVPITFVVVVVATVALVIFFGAWAVSLDASDRGGGPSFAVPGGSSMGAAPVFPGVPGSGEGSGADAAAQEAEGEGPVDTWWGKAFLKACPLH